MGTRGLGSRWRRRIGVATTLVTISLAGGLGIYDDGGALLAILSPPGAGYDSTSGLLYTARGGAVTVTRAGTLSCNGGTVAANMPCVEGGALRIPTGQTTTTELSPAPAAAPWCVSARLVRAAGDAAWNAGASTRYIWANDVGGNGLVRWYISTAGQLGALVFDAANGNKTWSTASATLSTQTAAKVRACYSGSAVAFWVDGASVVATPSGTGTGVLPGLNVTHELGGLSGATTLNAGIDGFCFHPSLTACQ